MGKRTWIYLIVLVAGSGIAFGLRYVPWENLNTATPQDLDRRAAEAARKYKPPKVSHDPTPDFARIDQASGPIYLFAHHHSAYYVIKKLQLQGALPRQGNILINFDCHDDANFPVEVPNPEDRDRALAFLDDDGLSPEQKLDPLRAFVKDKLNITSWVLPLIDDGSLSAYYYVFPRRHPLELAQRRFACSVLRQLAAGQLTESAGPKPPRAPQGFAFDVLRDDDLPPADELAGKSVIVTFDMDYFSNQDDLANDDDFDAQAQKPTEDEIRRAVASAVANLKSRGLHPTTIPVSESPGFTFPDQIPLITDVLLTALEKEGFAG